MKKTGIIVVFIFLLFSIYITCYRSLSYIKPEYWKIEEMNQKIKITVSRSISMTKWAHSYEKKGTELVVSIYTVSYLNPFYKDTGFTYSFMIPETFEDVEKIYMKCNKNEDILIYSKANS